jgi:hypothetical protein
MLFPDALPQIDDALRATDMLLSDEPPSGEDVSFGLELLSQPPVATLGKEDVLPFDAQATVSRPVPAKAWLESACPLSDSTDESADGNNLRPYHIALGMMPFLVAFGYTPSGLRDHVHVGQRVWKRLRGYLHRKP